MVFLNPCAASGMADVILLVPTKVASIDLDEFGPQIPILQVKVQTCIPVGIPVPLEQTTHILFHVPASFLFDPLFPRNVVPCTSSSNPFSFKPTEGGPSRRTMQSGGVIPGCTLLSIHRDRAFERF
jgi:hypothetical protein